MLIKAILLFLTIFIVSLPLWFSDKLKVEGSISDDLERIRRRSRRSRPKWNGPKTDERINRMFNECAAMLKDLGVPISDSIAPEVTLTSSKSYLGRCCPKGSLKKYTEYDFYIELSGFSLKDSEGSLRNTLIHELLHTVPGGMCHTGEWKKWAKYVNERTGYNIQRLS